MQQVDLTKLAAIPYLDISNLQGRFISSLCFYDERWRMWMVTENGLVETKAWPAESTYFAKAPQADFDIGLGFINLIAQRASFGTVMKAFGGIQDDIFNLSASLAKIELLHETRETIGHGVHRMAVTEIEYIMSVCRSLFDLLQEVVSQLWDFIQLLDPTAKKKALKDTFSDTLLFKGQLSTSEQLQERFGLPPMLAEVYLRHADFFMSLRKFRDNIVHRGSNIQTVFQGDDGFRIAGTLKPFAGIPIWRDDEREPNNLVPLMPALGMAVHRTLAACEDFAYVLEANIMCPPPIVPEMFLFMRGYFNGTLVRILKDADERTRTLA